MAVELPEGSIYRDVLFEINSKAKAARNAINRKDWASDGSAGHKEIRLAAENELKAYNRILKFIQEDEKSNYNNG